MPHGRKGRADRSSEQQTWGGGWIRIVYHRDPTNESRKLTSTIVPARKACGTDYVRRRGWRNFGHLLRFKKKLTSTFQDWSPKLSPGTSRSWLHHGTRALPGNFGLGSKISLTLCVEGPSWRGGRPSLMGRVCQLTLKVVVLRDWVLWEVWAKQRPLKTSDGGDYRIRFPLA